MDEIDWSVQQVNRLLGDPPASVPKVEIDSPEMREKKLFWVHPLQIDVNYELAKVYGDEHLIAYVYIVFYLQDSAILNQNFSPFTWTI